MSDSPPMMRMAPHSVEAEQGVLGSCMMDRQALAECIDRLSPECFYVSANRTIFIELGEQYQANEATDLITFTERLRQRNILDSVGGAAYVTTLFTFVPTAANVQYYREIVRERYLLREIIARCTEIVRVCFEDQIEVREALEQTQAALTEIIIQAERPDVFRHIKEGVLDAMVRLEQAYAHRGQMAVSGLATGIIDFDRMTGGLKGQQLVIVGARPSQGKTALAMNFASNMALKNGTAVGVFSMEMSFQEVVDRLFCSTTGISLQRFRDGFMSETDFPRASEEAGKIMDAKIWIDDTPALSLSSFKARARLMKMRHKIEAIVVDYLQLMRSTTKRAEQARWLEITEISGTLKAVAKELNIPVICCAQLNREAEGREFGKPKLSDLRESGSIEQDADIVVLLWRPERHIQHPKTENKKVAKMLGLKDDDGVELWGDDVAEHQIRERDRQIEEYAGFLVVKHRNGPVNNLRLRFIGKLTRFENVTEQSWSNNLTKRQK
jgi:replicative DNA helicase